jgi:uncharacterized membrane protein
MFRDFFGINSGTYGLWFAFKRIFWTLFSLQLLVTGVSTYVFQSTYFDLEPSKLHLVASTSLLLTAVLTLATAINLGLYAYLFSKKKSYLLIGLIGLLCIGPIQYFAAFFAVKWIYYKFDGNKLSLLDKILFVISAIAFLFVTAALVFDSNKALETTVLNSHEEFFIEIENRNTSVVYTSSVFEELGRIDSSFIDQALYDNDEKYLIIDLGDFNYQYCDVSKRTWNDFKNAKSLGSFYNKNIKGTFSCLPGQEPVYLGNICINNAIEYEKHFLASRGYFVSEDGSFKNSEEDWPSEILGAYSEELMNEVYFDCLNSGSIVTKDLTEYTRDNFEGKPEAQINFTEEQTDLLPDVEVSNKPVEVIKEFHPAVEDSIDWAHWDNQSEQYELNKIEIIQEIKYLEDGWEGVLGAVENGRLFVLDYPEETDNVLLFEEMSRQSIVTGNSLIAVIAQKQLIVENYSESQQAIRDRDFNTLVNLGNQRIDLNDKESALWSAYNKEMRKLEYAGGKFNEGITTPL